MKLILTCRCGLCSLSGEDLAEDESIRLKIRELSEEIERLESDPVEALKKAESKLELMENIRDRVILRFTSNVHFSKVHFSDSRSAFLTHCKMFSFVFHPQVSSPPAHLLQACQAGQLLKTNDKVQRKGSQAD